MKMKKARLIILFLLIPVLLLSQDNSSKIRLAVTYFDDSITSASEAEKAGNAVASMIEAVFKKQDRFYVRDRNAIADYISTLEKVQAGLLSPDMMKGDPASLKVDYLTVGTVSKIDGRYEIDARTVSIDRMFIVHAHGATCSTIQEAVGDIEWYIKEKFTEDYIKQRESDYDEEKSTVTVYKFRDENERAAKLEYGGTFAEILNSQMGNFISISTIERKYSKALINEKILEMAGVIENDDSGKSFSDKGIQYKVEGDIRVFSDMITVNYRVYETASGALVFMGSKDIGSTKGFRSVAWSISNTVEDALNNRIGTLKISSQPSGADVYIDGKNEGKTPSQISVVRGKHNLTVKMDGFIPFKGEIEIQSKTVTEQNVVLREVPYKLFEKAMIYEKKRDWEGAIAAYDEFIKTYGDTKEADNAYYRKGHIEMMFLKKYGDALKTFDALVKRYPDAMTRAEGYYGLMRAYELLGNREKAVEIKNYLLSYYGETNAAEEARKTNY